MRGPQGIFAKIPGLSQAFIALTKVLPLRRGKVVEKGRDDLRRVNFPRKGCSGLGLPKRGSRPYDERRPVTRGAIERPAGAPLPRHECGL